MAGNKNKPGTEHAPSTLDILQKIERQKEILERDRRLATKARQAVRKNMEPRNKKGLPQNLKASAKSSKVMAKQIRNRFDEDVLLSRKKLQSLYSLLSQADKSPPTPSKSQVKPTGTNRKIKR